MIGIIYISDQTYYGNLAELETSNGFPVGYYAILGNKLDVDKEVVKRTDLTLVGCSLRPTELLEGSIHSSDGVAAALGFIISMMDRHPNMEFIILTLDPYLLKVVNMWMSNWKEVAVKDNQHPIPHGDLWIKVKSPRVQWINNEAELGNAMADMHSLSNTPFQATTPFPLPPAIKHNPLLWMNYELLYRPTEVHYLAHVKELIEIGNLDTKTSYGAVVLNQPVESIELFKTWQERGDGHGYSLFLPPLQHPIHGATLNRLKLSSLAKPSKFSEVYMLGKDIELLTSVRPSNKFYLAKKLYVELSLLAKFLINQPCIAGKFDRINVVDITDALIEEGGVAKALLRGDSITCQMPMGKPRAIIMGAELPPLNTLRALVKQDAAFYLANLHLQGADRLILIIKTPQGLGVYTNYITKLLF